VEVYCAKDDEERDIILQMDFGLHVIVTQISNLNTGDGLFSVKKSHAICL
jgi:hypothetical protein